MVNVERRRPTGAKPDITVDSSGWIEYFADGPNSRFFEAAVVDVGSLVLPSISIYELFDRLLMGNY